MNTKLKNWFDLYNQKKSLESGQTYTFLKSLGQELTEEQTQNKIKEIEKEMKKLDKEGV